MQLKTVGGLSFPFDRGQNPGARARRLSSAEGDEQRALGVVEAIRRRGQVAYSGPSAALEAAHGTGQRGGWIGLIGQRLSGRTQGAVALVLP